ncbi:DHA1 family bicyclomycin/chloramphenicol resistance-like MFS transporter [Sphaerotilus hippei]|uniref:Bcr/CflA family efflux transporter n=1 Tax=Sphaerotilus hippei TaxID=744406 RepID=A0A318HHM6_9BURK|nr:multidrug effflux MFS transporter [Sphaerotilus hippei]PXW99573.1 DHA1 family bicyclomycin/chloramphenicol resistance-like MFS transporter [Sphaerotilus hippei]
MTRSLLRHALILGLLSAIGPFAIDMYLPALPEIGRSLDADIRQVQLSLMAFFLSLGLCQLVYGPLSDLWGRKRPLYLGLSLFALGSIGCALAPDIESLIAFRFVAGLGACAGMVVPRAIVRDLHTGTEATRLMSLLMLVFSVSPVLAPLAGSAVIAWADWRWIFWAVTAAAVLAMAMMLVFMEETRPAAERTDSSVAGALSAYGQLLRDRHFLGLVLIGAFGMSSFFSYLANSSFVLIGHYGLSPTQYSFFFSINAAAFIGVAQVNARLCARLGLPGVIRLGVIGHAGTAVLLWALFTLAGVDRLDVLAALVFVSFGFLGLVIPTTSVLALEPHGRIAGTASALLGTLQMVTGAAVMAVISAFVDGSARPMVTGIGACALVAAALTWRTLAPARPAAAVVH